MFEIENETKQVKTDFSAHIEKKNKKYVMKNLTVQYFDESCTFLFHENNKNIGSISIKEIIKYAVLTVDNDKILDIPLSESKVHLIEKYICNTYQDANSFYVEFNSPEKSLFMTDVELLIKLNKELTNFEEKYISTIKNENIVNVIKQLVYNLLDIILKLLYSLSYKIKDKKSNESYLLLKYTDAIVNKINKRIFKDVNEKIKNIDTIYNETKKLNGYSKILEQKIDILNKNIQHQSDVAEHLVNKSASEKIITENETATHANEKREINDVIKHMSNDDIDDVNTTDESVSETQFSESTSPNILNASEK